MQFFSLCGAVREQLSLKHVRALLWDEPKLLEKSLVRGIIPLFIVSTFT